MDAACPPVRLRADDRVDVECVVARELVEVALPVGYEPDAQLVPPQLGKHGWRILVQREVLVPLPLAHHVDGARACPVLVPAHAGDDPLGERDPDLLVMDELAMSLELLDGVRACLPIAIGIEDEPMPLTQPPVSLGPQLGAGPEEREVDIEEDRPEHGTRIGRTRRQPLESSARSEAEGRFIRP